MSPLLKIAAIAGAALAAAGAQAQAFPGGKPITLIVPFAAGGPTDKVARDLADAMRKPLGGATVVVTGSHRRLAALATATGAPIGHVDAPAALAAVEPWFAALVEGGAADGGCVSDGVPLAVAELTGAAGDVLFLDARCLHTISANASTGPRLVMRLTCMAAAPA